MLLAIIFSTICEAGLLQAKSRCVEYARQPLTPTSVLVIYGAEAANQREGKDFAHRVFVARVDEKSGKTLGRSELLGGDFVWTKALVNTFELGGKKMADVVLTRGVGGTGLNSVATDFIFSIDGDQLTPVAEIPTGEYTRHGWSQVNDSASEVYATPDEIIIVRQQRYRREHGVICKTTRTAYSIDGGRLKPRNVGDLEIAQLTATATPLKRLWSPETPPCSNP